MKKVIVLLSTYNGGTFLETQINSLLNQTGIELQIIARDDGSSDNTIDILKKYSSTGHLTWYTGDNVGAAKSFLDLVRNAPDGDYYAFCDQDDYWMPDKLISAVDKLSKYSDKVPNLYYSNYTLVDSDLNVLPSYNGSADSTYIANTMKKAIISGRATGCTMVFNKRLAELLRLFDGETFVLHDNWTHKVCVATGGNLVFDPQSHIYYRQHGNNTVGVSRNIIKRMKRNYILASKRKCYTSNAIKVLLGAYGDYMTEDSYKTCKQIANYREGFNRFKVVLDKGYKTDRKKSNYKFVINVLLGVF